MLEALDRGNLFLVPLDDRRRWYRYHHLFADVLRARLLDEQPDQVPELHRRASDWYEQNGERSEAIRHALAGRGLRASGGPDRARDARRCASGRQEATLRRWLEALPDERLSRQAGARASRYVGALSGQRRARGRRGAPAGRRAVAGRDGRRAGRTRGRRDRRWSSSTRRSSAACRARSRSTGPRWPWPRAMSPAPIDPCAAGARPRRPRTIISAAAAAAGFLGLASWTSGDLEAAHRSYADAVASLREGRVLLRRPRLRHRPGRHPDRAGPSPRGDAHLRARRCSSRRDRARRRSAERRTCTWGMSELLRERNDLAGRDAAPAGEQRARRARGPGAEPRIAGASRWPGSGRPKETWTARSSCSTRPSACT